RVINRQTGSHAAPRRVDVNVDILLRVGALQEEKLRRHQAGHRIIDRRSDEHDPVHQQPREDVHGALAALGLLQYERNIQAQSLSFRAAGAASFLGCTISSIIPNSTASSGPMKRSRRQASKISCSVLPVCSAISL